MTDTYWKPHDAHRYAKAWLWYPWWYWHLCAIWAKCSNLASRHELEKTPMKKSSRQYISLSMSDSCWMDSCFRKRRGTMCDFKEFIGSITNGHAIIIWERAFTWLLVTKITPLSMLILISVYRLLLFYIGKTEPRLIIYACYLWQKPFIATPFGSLPFITWSRHFHADDT